MFREEVARCAVLAGRLRMLCRFSIPDEGLRNEALDLCAELEDLLERPSKVATDEQRERWAEQKRAQRAKNKEKHGRNADVSARTSADSPRTSSSSSGSSGSKGGGAGGGDGVYRVALAKAREEWAKRKGKLDGAPEDRYLAALARVAKDFNVSADDLRASA